MEPTPKGPEPVILPTREEAAPDKANEAELTARSKRLLAKRSFKPGLKGTVIGGVVALLLVGANVAVVAYVVQRANQADTAKPTLTATSAQDLFSLGANKDTVGQSGVSLVVTPDAEFKGNVVVTKDLKLNSGLAAGSAQLGTLQAGASTFSDINVSGTSTVSNLNIRQNFVTTGASALNGPVTVSQVLTAATLNVTGNLSVGGTLAASTFSARSLVSSSTLVIGGHVITSGRSPAITAGPAVGNSGTANVGGNDSSGTVNITTGQTPGSGIVANITFTTAYGSVPRITIAPVGASTGRVNYYILRTTTGFQIGIEGMAPTSTYTFDYIVQQ